MLKKFEDYVFDEWRKNEISNGDWIQFREWLKDQEAVVEINGDITKVVVKGVEYMPVNRCKDCIYYRQEIDMCDEPYSTAHNVVYEDDYCSRAERKEK